MATISRAVWRHSSSQRLAHSFSTSARQASEKPDPISDLLTTMKSTNNRPTPSNPFSADRSSRPLNNRRTDPQSRTHGPKQTGPSALTRHSEGILKQQQSTARASQTNANGISPADLAQHRPRPQFIPGSIYSPHDLTGNAAAQNALHARRNRTPKVDVFDMLRINPLHEYKNFSMIAEFVTTAGRIKGRKETGLRLVNQRRMAKAVRRAVGLGLVPSVHHHPELIRLMRVGEERRARGGIDRQ